jgi:hypothetical protein
MSVTMPTIVVVVSRPTPKVVRVSPSYTPRKPHERKRWPLYSSLLGTFHRGSLQGRVRIEIFSVMDINKYQ